jgi:hypothetical protein
MADIQKVEITLEMLENAPERTTSRGRTKGTSPMEKSVRSFYEDENTEHDAWRVTNSQYQALKLAVCRLDGTDSSKKDDYENALESLRLEEIFLGQSGQGSERVQTIALRKAFA